MRDRETVREGDKHSEGGRHRQRQRKEHTGTMRRQIDKTSDASSCTARMFYDRVEFIYTCSTGPLWPHRIRLGTRNKYIESYS